MTPARLGRALLAASIDTRSAVIVLGITAWVVYHPAMNRVFVVDQLWYFAELNGDHSFLAGLRHYDYAATRQFWKGDDALFRPLLFVWLAAGNRLFTYHHTWWNVANLALHTLVSVSLFRLFMAIRPSVLALPAAVLFLVLMPSVELVTWNHLGGYLIAGLFLSVGLRAFVRLVRNPLNSSDRWTYAFAFTAAGLCYEAMVPVSAAGAAILVWIRWRSRAQSLITSAVVLLVPAMVFSFLYAFHISRIERPYSDPVSGSGLFEPSHLVDSLRQAPALIARFASELAFPTALTLASSAFGRFGQQFSISLDSPVQVMNAMMTLLAIVLLIRSVSADSLTRGFPLLALMTTAVVIYVTILGIGRPPDEVLSTTYYVYLFAVFASIGLYALVDFSRLSGWRMVGASCTLATFIALHAARTAEAATDVERINHYQSLYLTRVISFVDAHRREPGFSFAIQERPESLDPTISLVVGYPSAPDGSPRELRVTQILFAPYYSISGAKYLLTSSAEGLVQ